jgi:hypothetical protein
MKTLLNRCATASLVFLIIAGFISCSTKKQNPVYLNADLKKYFDYQIGTYWLFYDSLNHRTDSLYVFSNHDDLPFWDGKTPTETIDIYLYDNLSWELILNSPYGSYIFMNDTGEYIDPLTKYMPFYTDGINSTLLPFYKIGAVTYKNVYKIISTETGDIYYINADCGFLAIQQIKYTRKNLYLIKCNIVH